MVDQFEKCLWLGLHGSPFEMSICLRNVCGEREEKSLRKKLDLRRADCLATLFAFFKPEIMISIARMYGDEAQQRK